LPLIFYLPTWQLYFLHGSYIAFIFIRDCAVIINIVVAAIRAQIQMMRHNIEDLLPLLTTPLVTIIALAIFINSGRQDLAPYAIVAATLMTIGQMGFFAGSELIAKDRNEQVLELLIVTPTPYWVLLIVRILTLTFIGLFGFFASWAIAVIFFGIQIKLYFPGILFLTLLATVIATSATCLITVAVFCLGKTPRTLQNSITGPLYLLGGVLVPVTFLPNWVEPIAQGIFFYWSADLMRNSLQANEPQQVFVGISMILMLGCIGGVLGIVLLRRMFNKLRKDGTLSVL
jgi:ABC-2 type transport system permease protein